MTKADDVKLSQAAAILGKKGGLSKSAAKGKTARVNGVKGGRPKKKKVAKGAS